MLHIFFRTHRTKFRLLYWCKLTAEVLKCYGFLLIIARNKHKQF